jgi:hypothetical protein
MLYSIVSAPGSDPVLRYRGDGIDEAGGRAQRNSSFAALRVYYRGSRKRAAFERVCTGMGGVAPPRIESGAGLAFSLLCRLVAP